MVLLPQESSKQANWTEWNAWNHWIRKRPFLWVDPSHDHHAQLRGNTGNHTHLQHLKIERNLSFPSFLPQKFACWQRSQGKLSQYKLDQKARVYITKVNGCQFSSKSKLRGKRLSNQSWVRPGTRMIEIVPGNNEYDT